MDRFASYMSRTYIKVAARWEKYPRTMTALFFLNIALKVYKIYLEREKERLQDRGR